MPNEFMTSTVLWGIRVDRGWCVDEDAYQRFGLVEELTCLHQFGERSLVYGVLVSPHSCPDQLKKRVEEFARWLFSESSYVGAESEPQFWRIAWSHGIESAGICLRLAH